MPIGGLDGYGAVQEIPQPFTEVIEAAEAPAPARAARLQVVLRDIDTQLQAAPQDPILRLKKGMLLHLVGDLEQARTVLESVIPGTPELLIRSEAMFQLGLVTFKQSRYEDSAYFFRRCVTDQPDRANAHVNLGVALVQLGQLEAARETLKKALEIDRHSTVAVFYLGYLAHQQGDADRTQYYWITNGRVVEPENTVFSEWAAQLQRDDPRLRELRAALLEHPEDGGLHIELSAALVRSGNFKEAASHAEEALRLLPDYWGSHAQMGQVLFYQRRYREALAAYEQAIARNPERRELQLARGAIYIFLGELKPAKAVLLNLLQEDPNDLVAHAVLGQVYCFLNDLTQAEAEYQICQRLGANNPEVEELAMRISRLRHGYPDHW